MPALGFWFLVPGIDAAGFIDATSNRGRAAESEGIGSACARRSGAFQTPMTIGAAIAAMPANIRANVFARFSFTTASYFMIASILVLRYAPPAIPATHSTGDSRYNSHTLRMPCAYTRG